MIRSIRISNYRSLGGDLDVALGPLTALVGPNGAGKSNFLDALAFLADAMHLGLESALTKRQGIGAVRRWGAGRPFDVKLEVEAAGGDWSGSYSFTLTGDRIEEQRVKSETAAVQGPHGVTQFRAENGSWESGPADLRPKVSPNALALPLLAADERFRPLADELRGIAVYTIFPDTLREPQKYDPAKPMGRNGQNWASILKDDRDGTLVADLVAVLERLTGDVRGLRAKPVGGYITVKFEHRVPEGTRRTKWFDAAQESDGTLRVAGIVTALRQAPAPTLIGLEEPELTVHPGAFDLIIDYVREATADRQVVLTTHSPELLDRLLPEEIRLVSPTPDGSRIDPVPAERVALVREGLFGLGELHRGPGLDGGSAAFPFQVHEP